MQTFFITGIGTDVGKTVAAAIVVEAFGANYWKPVQAGFSAGTDAATVKSLITNKQSKFFSESYKLKLPASPHIAAREENIKIDLEKIYADFKKIDEQSSSNDILIIEGAGGLLVPLNENEFVIDLIKKIDAKTILVSRNYLGSINHSLLSASVCKINNINVAGWIFNGDDYLNYEDEIKDWSGFPKIGSLPILNLINKEFVKQQALKLKPNLSSLHGY